MTSENKRSIIVVDNNETIHELISTCKYFEKLNNSDNKKMWILFKMENNYILPTNFGGILNGNKYTIYRLKLIALILNMIQNATIKNLIIKHSVIRN